ncbi:CMGC family protein kinase [Histomonas meleagridis]|uniref:CMGC family protein kinase n=1 Tax=Histomonas meleagridis TaxID=135588 RepID=UPI00355A42C7|nr:CMGC family protein kinase [Histomonas meleagridis]KAH0800184.1 CMGC family protein kinase [Histomonas meleagridis]
MRDKEFESYALSLNYPGLRIENEIGRGRFASVYKGIWQDNQDVAVKILNPSNNIFSNNEGQILSEIQQCPHVIKLIAAPTDCPILIMEFKQGISSKKLIDQLTPERIKFLLKSILECLESVHSKGFIHADLTMSNIIVSPEFDDVTIIDWGSSCRLSSSMPSSIGSRTMRSPEMLFQSEKFGTKGDIWAVGTLILLILCDFKLPWDSRNQWGHLVEMTKFFGGRRILEYAESLGKKIPECYSQKFEMEKTADIETFFSPKRANLQSEELIELMKSLLTLDMNQRPTAKEALESKYFK